MHNQRVIAHGYVPSIGRESLVQDIVLLAMLLTLPLRTFLLVAAEIIVLGGPRDLWVLSKAPAAGALIGAVVTLPTIHSVPRKVGPSRRLG